MAPGFDPAWVFPAASIGAMVTLAILLAVSSRSSFSPDNQLSVGVSLASFMTAVSSIALTSGDPRVGLFLSWMSGSFYGITALQAGLTCGAIRPLSFIGLMAPHMARISGLQRPVSQPMGAAIFGALIMVFADWIGRSLLSPWQLPAGLVASLIGAPYFIWRFRKAGTS